MGCFKNTIYKKLFLIVLFSAEVEVKSFFVISLCRLIEIEATIPWDIFCRGEIWYSSPLLSDSQALVAYFLPRNEGEYNVQFSKDAALVTLCMCICISYAYFNRRKHKQKHRYFSY